MIPDTSSVLPGESLTLSDDAIQVRMMRELFTRTRESSPLGFLPVFLLAWAHVGAQPLHYLVYWAISTVFVLTYRFLVAHVFLRQPQLQMKRRMLDKSEIVTLALNTLFEDFKNKKENSVLYKHTAR